jgi:hypothetical protein
MARAMVRLWRKMSQNQGNGLDSKFSDLTGSFYQVDKVEDPGDSISTKQDIEEITGPKA